MRAVLRSARLGTRGSASSPGCRKNRRFNCVKGRFRSDILALRGNGQRRTVHVADALVAGEEKTLFLPSVHVPNMLLLGACRQAPNVALYYGQVLVLVGHGLEEANQAQGGRGATRGANKSPRDARRKGRSPVCGRRRCDERVDMATPYRTQGGEDFRVDSAYYSGDRHGTGAGGVRTHNSGLAGGCDSNFTTAPYLSRPGPRLGVHPSKKRTWTGLLHYLAVESRRDGSHGATASVRTENLPVTGRAGDGLVLPQLQHEHAGPVQGRVVCLAIDVRGEFRVTSVWRPLQKGDRSLLHWGPLNTKPRQVTSPQPRRFPSQSCCFYVESCGLCFEPTS